MIINNEDLKDQRKLKEIHEAIWDKIIQLIQNGEIENIHDIIIGAIVVEIEPDEELGVLPTPFIPYDIGRNLSALVYPTWQEVLLEFWNPLYENVEDGIIAANMVKHYWPFC